jgi:hypothetical protein
LALAAAPGAGHLVNEQARRRLDALGAALNVPARIVE